MAELRCPMCGKPNPAEREICQFCQARLKPLIGGDQPEAAEPAAPKDQDTLSPPPEDKASIDQWLSSLRDSGEGSQEPFDEDQPEEFDQDQESELPESPFVQDDQSADWLSSLRSESDEVSGDSAEDSSRSDLDWLSALEPSDEENVPGWLKNVASGSGAVDSEAAGMEDSPVEAAPGDEPEWLQKIRTRQMAESDQEEVSGQINEFEPGEEVSPLPDEQLESGKGAAADEDATDWLAQLRGDEQPAGEPDELPDWLEDEASAEQSPPETEKSMQAELPEQALEASGEDISEEAAAIDQGDTEEEPVESAPAEEKIPDWMAGVVAGAIAAESIDEGAGAEGLPEWLADLEKSSALDQDEIVPFGEEGEELTFDWLQAQVREDQDITFGDMPASDAVGVEGETAIGPFVGDLSDFLEDAEIDAIESEPTDEEKLAAGLMRAELPVWLEAMRPVDAAEGGVLGVDDKDASIESSGPLAGLRGVLPAEPEIAQLKKPALYALRLQVTDAQQAHADLFDELIKSEGESKPVAGRPAVSTQYIFRLVIFGVLVLAIFWPIFTASRTNPLPALMPETFDTSAIINKLPNNPKVLLAADYDPGLAGEMEAAASAVVDHMMLKGAYLALVSTTPNGPALGERLVADISSRSGHTYQDINQYANLGYIPGGQSGLFGLAQAPRQVIPYALDAETTYVWGREPLLNVQTLADFDLVMVISDDPDKARAWIEQVQPTLGATPLAMVVSTQAEPLVRPYYQASPKQVQGLVAGLAGGGAYENAHQDLAGGNGLVRIYWDAYSLSLLAAALLIGIGGLVNVGANLLSNQEQSKTEKKP